ncbi:U3 small nucleolar RNA-associated protein 25 homolog isoform X2 [Paroedura picta]|uniref:U3 small nucleolar RNA-associated protein 25 homolog isoform X2 n=1 Tax=Paroedura picta TaxID=143630 RepID=UPI004057035F
MGKRKARQQRQQLISHLSKKQKKHLKDFGEEHPFHDRVSVKEEPTQICELSDDSDPSVSESDAESDSEQVSVYHKLLATLKAAPYSDNEEEEEDDDDDDSEEGNVEDLIENNKEFQDEGETGDEDSNGDIPDQESAPVQKPSQEEPGEADISSDIKNEEFTDEKHEAEFSLETNFIEETADQKESCTSTEATKDPFKLHMDEELNKKDVDKILERSKSTSQVKWPVLCQLVFSCTLEKFGVIKPDKEASVKHLPLHRPLEITWPKVNNQFLSKQPKSDQLFTPLQKELFCIMNSYKDLFYPERTALRNGEEIRHVYCLHAINHILKANDQVLSNNAQRRDQKPGIEDDGFRDQGLTRPKVLIVVPFRESALRVVQVFISLLESASKKKIDVSNKKRFKGEFGSDPDEKPPNLKRPEDYEAVFAGNIDDHFRIGVAVLQKSMRLYAPFYSSDVIIASPLGLRTVIGAEGEKKRDYDFLSSIEMLIIDEADVYLMQNWEHILHLLAHINLLPLESHGVDFSRVRMFSLNNWSKYYRQTLLFGALQDPQINSIFNKHCLNYQGQVAVRNVPLVGSISHVVVQLPHVFRKLEAENSVSVIDARYTVKGIRNLIFYELPTYPHFYSEVCNMMKLADGGEGATLTCTALYSKYDAQKLTAVVGVERAAQMLQSSKNVHLFVTGETE